MMEKVRCDVCNGSGKIINGTPYSPYDCPMCLGTGYLYKYYITSNEDTSGYVRIGDVIIK